MSGDYSPRWRGYGLGWFVGDELKSYGTETAAQARCDVLNGRTDEPTETDLGDGLIAREYSPTRVEYGVKSPDGTWWIVGFALEGDDRGQAVTDAREALAYIAGSAVASTGGEL